MEYAVTNSFDAEIEHHRMHMAASIMPNVPLQNKEIEINGRSSDRFAF